MRMLYCCLYVFLIGKGLSRTKTGVYLQTFATGDQIEMNPGVSQTRERCFILYTWKSIRHGRYQTTCMTQEHFFFFLTVVVINHGRHVLQANNMCCGFCVCVCFVYVLWQVYNLEQNSYRIKMF